MLVEDLEIALKVAEHQSITAAALNLDIRTATASAALKRVERQLGTPLFERTTRQLRLSKAGEDFLPQCKHALALLESARRELQQDAQQASGTIKLSVSSDLGRNLILPWLDAFLDHNPKIKLKMNIDDQLSDFYKAPVDMALRYGPPSDSNLFGFKICETPVALFASPQYLKNTPPLTGIKDLNKHQGLFYQIEGITYNQWSLKIGQTQHKIKMKGQRHANDGDIVKRWCLAGKGIALKSVLDMSEELLANKVTYVLPQLINHQPLELWIVFPSKQTITPAVKQLKDFLKQKTHAQLKKLGL